MAACTSALGLNRSKVRAAVTGNGYAMLLVLLVALAIGIVALIQLNGAHGTS